MAPLDDPAAKHLLADRHDVSCHVTKAKNVHAFYVTKSKNVHAFYFQYVSFLHFQSEIPQLSVEMAKFFNEYPAAARVAPV
jgi:hypothetical protein